MNTSLPPFDRVDVRKAISLATDRARVRDLFGGELAGRVTCQVTPPGFPGYEPYCPDTIDPGQAWRGPDKARASALIDDAGVRGTEVTVWSPAYPRPEFRAVNAYFADLLNELGFEASLKVMSLDRLDAAPNGFGTDIQMIGMWFPGMSASSMIAGAFTCADFQPVPDSPGNYAALCDRDVDALALEATDLQATDPTAASRTWAKVDRMIVDQSPAVFAFNPIELAFVSKRVGNVQVHPIFGVLISQMWVQ